MPDILLTGLEIATNTSLLANSRLETLPQGSSFLHFRCAANVTNGTNNMRRTIELPSGLIPVDGQLVPANADGTSGVLDERTLMQWTWPAIVGGRFIISIVEAGTAEFFWLAQRR